MESHELFDVFAGEMCAGCGGRKRRLVAFCPSCYRELPKALKNALWQRFGHGLEEAYHGLLVMVPRSSSAGRASSAPKGAF
jgi:predicted amidophosphoribosyltransferase